MLRTCTTEQLYTYQKQRVICISTFLNHTVHCYIIFVCAPTKWNRLTRSDWIFQSCKFWIKPGSVLPNKIEKLWRLINNFLFISVQKTLCSQTIPYGLCLVWVVWSLTRLATFQKWKMRALFRVSFSIYEGKNEGKFEIYEGIFKNFCAKKPHY